MAWLSSNDTGEHPEVDNAYLDRLVEVLGDEKLSEVLSDGLLELADRLDQLRRLARADRRDELAAVAHDMVGTAGQMGLTRLSLAAADLERTARRPGVSLAAEVETIGDRTERGVAELEPRVRPDAAG